MRERYIFSGGRKAGEKEEGENMVAGRGRITRGCGERKTRRRVGVNFLQRGGVDLATNNGTEEGNDRGEILHIGTEDCMR